MKARRIFLSLVASMLLSTTLFAKDSITISNVGLYPEGISFDAKEKAFYVSSVARGEVWKVKENGESELFVSNKKYPSIIGLKVDGERNRLVICVSDPGVGVNSTASSKGMLAGVATYDLKSGKKLAYHALSSLKDSDHHFANDVAIDAIGNIYVTDSFSPVIYKIAENGKVSVLANYPKWGAAKGKFGLNGIVYHPDGFLIVSQYDSGKLYKVDTTNPSRIREVVLNKPSDKWKISGLDGLLLLENKSLAAVNVDPSGRKNGNVVYRLMSKDDWNSFDINAVMLTGNTYPTSLTKDGKSIYVLHSKLLELFTGKKEPSKTFEIEKVVFSTLNKREVSINE